MSCAKHFRSISFFYLRHTIALSFCSKKNISHINFQIKIFRQIAFFNFCRRSFNTEQTFPIKIGKSAHRHACQKHNRNNNCRKGSFHNLLHCFSSSKYLQFNFTTFIPNSQLCDKKQQKSIFCHTFKFLCKTTKY